MRFLVIDDSVTMRRIIANILGRLGYPDVAQAGNGREALDRLATEQIDIVITDWYMPEMNGLDFVKALRTTPATSHIPIVIVTANAASDDIEHALELGINSYILKPFTAETMRDKISALIPASVAAGGDPAAEAATATQEAPAGAPGATAAAATPADEMAVSNVPATDVPQGDRTAAETSETDTAETDTAETETAETGLAAAVPAEAVAAPVEAPREPAAV